MKRKNALKMFNLVSMMLIVSVTVINTSAQTSVRPLLKIGEDTALAKKKIESFTVEVYQEPGAEKFILAISNPFAEKLRISISAIEGIGFMDNTKALSYRKRFNMSGAQDGNYTLTVIGDKKTFTKIIRLETEMVQTRNINIE